MEKLKLISNMELDYVTEWEKARYEQNSLRCNMEIEKLEKMLKDQRVREKNERRVHAELTKFLTQETAVSVISVSIIINKLRTFIIKFVFFNYVISYKIYK